MTDRVRLVYSLIQYTPVRGREESVNLGVILCQPGVRIMAKFLPLKQWPKLPLTDVQKKNLERDLRTIYGGPRLLALMSEGSLLREHGVAGPKLGVRYPSSTSIRSTEQFEEHMDELYGCYVVPGSVKVQEGGYRTVFTITVLSDDPLPQVGMKELPDLLREYNDGDLICQNFKVKVEKVSGPRMRRFIGQIQAPYPTSEGETPTQEKDTE